jgi:hypothetical protein
MEVWKMLKTILMIFWKSLWNLLQPRPRRTLPQNLRDESYAVIKLKKFDNLEVAIMFDKDNGGMAISYEDAHLDSTMKQAVENEIQAIVSSEMEKIQEED